VSLLPPIRVSRFRANPESNNKQLFYNEIKNAGKNHNGASHHFFRICRHLLVKSTNFPTDT